MKNILLISVILLAGLSLFAQETTIDKAEFDKAMAGNYLALRNQPYRTIEESVSEGTSNSSKIKIVTERFGPAIRSIFESDSPASYMKTETIFISGKRFTKKLNNPWVEETLEVKTPPLSEYENVSDPTVYKALGEGLLNDKKVKIYKTISSRTSVNKEKGNSYSVTDTTTHYFDATGALIRSETLSEMIHKPKNEADSAIVLKERKTVTKRTKITEIDPNIKIEAPQIG